MGQFSPRIPSRRNIMLRYTAVIVLLLSLGANAQRRGGRAQSFRRGRDGSAAGDYSPPQQEYSADTGVASYGGAASDAANDPLAALSSSVPGVPGEDYPIYSEVPDTAFSCDGQIDGGYYADEEAQCQVFHICTADGAGGLAKYGFLCPNGTIFNQNYFICDWWFNVDCSESAAIAEAKNSELAAAREDTSVVSDQAAAASDAAGSYVSPAQESDAGYLAPASDAAGSYLAPDQESDAGYLAPGDDYQYEYEEEQAGYEGQSSYNKQRRT